MKCFVALFLSMMAGQSLISRCQAFAPPPTVDTNDDWMPVDAYRQQHGIQFEYEPRHISPEVCRYLNETECAQEDKAARETYQRHLRTMESLRRRRLQTTPATSKGSFKAMVLLVQFADHQNRPLPSKEYFEELCNGAGTSTVNPIGSIKSYFSEQSQGLYDVDCEVFDWRTTTYTEADAAQGISGILSNANAQKFFHPVLDQIDAEKVASSGDFWLFFEGFDADGEDGMGDGFIDALVVIHSGFGAQVAEICDGVRRADRIWSQGRSTSEGFGWNPRNIEVGSYSIASAFERCSTDRPALMGVITHEWLHTFGVPDLYGKNNFRFGGIGSFGMMSSPYGQTGDGSTPGSLVPWTRNRIGWLEYNEITTDGTYSVSGLQAYAIRDKFPADEFLVIECRFPSSFDSDFWGIGGIVFYHIDDKMGGQDRPGWPGQSGWPANGNHYQVAVLQADGRYDIEQDVNSGDIDDLWVDGMALRPNGGSGIFPNTDSYQGTPTVTGITIRIVSSPGKTMQFVVEGLASNPNQLSLPTPFPSGLPSHSPVIGIAATPFASPSQSNPYPLCTSSITENCFDQPTAAPKDSKPCVPGMGVVCSDGTSDPQTAPTIAPESSKDETTGQEDALTSSAPKLGDMLVLVVSAVTIVVTW